MVDFFRYLIARSIPYLPMIILLLCIYGFDPQKKEKKLRFSLLLFGAGIAVAIPVTVLDAARLRLLSKAGWEYVEWLRAGSAVLIIVLEQYVKVKVIKKIIWKSLFFQNNYDAVVYSVLLSLGYSLITSCLWYGQGELTLWAGYFVLPVMRACFAVYQGAYIAKEKYASLTEDKKKERGNRFLSVFIPGLLQAIYCCIVSGTEFMLDLEARQPHEMPDGKDYNAALAVGVLSAIFWMVGVGIYAFVVYIPTLGKVVKESKVRFRILNTSGGEQML